MKKNQPPPLPQPTLNTQLILTDTIKSTIDSFTAANTAIDRIVDKGTKILYNAYLWKKLPKHVSDFTISAYTEAMTQEVMPYDPGESIDCLICNWMEDEEPESTIMDSWTVQTARIVKPRAPTPTTMNNDSFISIGDAGSKRNSLMNRFKNTTNRLSLILRQPTKKLSTKTNLDHVPEKVNLLKQQYDVQVEHMPVPKEEEDPIVDEIRGEIALRKKIKQKKLDEAEEVRLKKEELKDKIKAFERQSKDNAFTFDYEGNVIYVSKQNNIKKKTSQNFNLKHPLETLRRLPSNAPIRSLESEGDDLQKLSLLSTKQLTSEKFGLSKTTQFRDGFDVKPGVMLKMTNASKQGPEYKDENRMRRDDFMKILEARKNDKGRPRELNRIVEEEETDEVKRRVESELMSQLKKLAEMNQQHEIEIHEQDMLIQMLMNTDSRKISELHDLMNGKFPKLDTPRDEPGSARKSIMEDRIVEYNQYGLADIKKPKSKPTTAKSDLRVQVSKVQQGLDNYNRNLLQKETWGQEKPRLSQISLTPITTPRLSPEKKSALKTSLFESHAPKEPRERSTVGQKRAIAQTARVSVDPDAVTSPSDGLLSARGDAEGKKFIIKSNTPGKEKISDDFGLKLKAQAQGMTKTGMSKNDSAMKMKGSASTSITKSNVQTPRRVVV